MRTAIKPSRPPKRRRFQIILTVPQYEAIKAKADAAGESVSTMIRRAIEQSTKESDA